TCLLEGGTTCSTRITFLFLTCYILELSIVILFYFFIKIQNWIKFFFVKFYYFYIGKAGKLKCFPAFLTE
ncbi:hypothetical protein DSH82_12070, partial [Enterococcus faecalis]|nr:hypothetical protein [Enterococcus faecalis]